MINVAFQCPRCKNKLNNTFSCLFCSRNYFNKKGFFDFTNNPTTSTKLAQKSYELLFEISSYGYSEGLQRFLKKNPEFEPQFNMMEGSIAFRIINKNNNRCLIINSEFGNIPENLSHMFNEIYSLETNEEKVLIQRFRFQKNNIDNIVLIRADIKMLPFPDKYFDLVVLNGIKLDQQDNEHTKMKRITYFKEIQRILSSNGCLCIGAENKYGLKVFGKEPQHGIDNKSFEDSYHGYKSFLCSLGFNVKPYWVLPSHRKPHYSGSIIDDISLGWFFKNFDKKYSVDTKYKILGLFLKALNVKMRRLFIQTFSPSFLLYCYNNEVSKSLEDIIVEQTGFKNLVQNVRLTKIMYILLDELGEPKKILSCKLTNYDLTEKIVAVKRIFPSMKDPEEKMIMEEWFSGEILNRLNSNEINMVMKWLVDFQKKTASDLLRQEEVQREIDYLKNELAKISVMNNFPYEMWLTEYMKHITKIKLRKTGVHGDLQVRNILVDRENSSINVIDWDWRFQEKGNPLYDFVWFAISIMMLSNDVVKEFSSNLNGTGKAVSSIEIIKETMKIHFKADLDFIIIVRFMILRFITIKIKENNTGYLTYVELLKVLANKNNSVSR